MVAKSVKSPSSKDAISSSDANALTEMHAAMDELGIQNQSLEDDVINIQQRQQEA